MMDPDNEDEVAPQPAKFQFVTVTSSAPELSAESRYLIKKHVMKDIGLARRRYVPEEPHRRPGATKPSTSSLSRKSSSDSSKSLSPAENRAATQSPDDLEPVSYPNPHSPKPGTILGAGRIDPFESFSVPSNAEVDILVDHSKCTFLEALFWLHQPV